MKPHDIVLLAQRLNRFLTSTELRHVQITVPQQDWDTLREWMEQYVPITEVPKPDEPELPVKYLTISDIWIVPS